MKNLQPGNAVVNTHSKRGVIIKYLPREDLYEVLWRTGETTFEVAADIDRVPDRPIEESDKPGPWLDTIYDVIAVVGTFLLIGALYYLVLS